MFTAICWCTSYHLFFGRTKSWEACHVYFLCIIFYAVVTILIEMNSKKVINISLFVLFFKSI